jgi:outer membrane protein assembly factor BamE (lipoprotein component of BamABCDE complex)
MFTNKSNIVFFSIIALTISLTSCAPFHASSVTSHRQNQLTVGVVQKSITKGMTGGQVAEILGSPNIVSTGENNNEVWIYDRFSTDHVKSSSAGLLVIPFFPAAGATSASANSTSQSSITVVIKFDNQQKVKDIAYHKSTF